MRLEARFATLLMICGFVFAGCGPVAMNANKSLSLGEKLVPSPKELDLPNSEPSPDKYRVKLETSEGDVIIEVTRAWAPRGSDRFYTLVKNHFYDGCRFFRVVPRFMAQIGINGDPRVTTEWQNSNIPDDPVKESNLREYVTFATSGKDSRTTQFFINFRDNSRLDRDGFSPFGRVVEGMDHVDSLYDGYGESPNQGEITRSGNQYLAEKFPQVDYIIKATIVSEDNKEVSAKTESKK
jgi:peptidyl-prolyl cis-trans isomerase A (cyclophilin A)